MLVHVEALDLDLGLASGAKTMVLDDVPAILTIGPVYLLFFRISPGAGASGPCKDPAREPGRDPVCHSCANVDYNNIEGSWVFSGVNFDKWGRARLGAKRGVSPTDFTSAFLKLRWNRNRIAIHSDVGMAAK